MRTAVAVSVILCCFSSAAPSGNQPTWNEEWSRSADPDAPPVWSLRIEFNPTPHSVAEVKFVCDWTSAAQDVKGPDTHVPLRASASVGALNQARTLLEFDWNSGLTHWNAAIWFGKLREVESHQDGFARLPWWGGDWEETPPSPLPEPEVNLRVPTENFEEAFSKYLARCAEQQGKSGLNAP